MEAAIAAMKNDACSIPRHWDSCRFAKRFAAWYGTRFGVKVDPSRGRNGGFQRGVVAGARCAAGQRRRSVDPGIRAAAISCVRSTGCRCRFPAAAAERYQLTTSALDPLALAHARRAGGHALQPTGTLISWMTNSRISMTPLTRARGAMIVDEIYQGPDLWAGAHHDGCTGEDVFVINSFSKYFQMTGWRHRLGTGSASVCARVETLAQNLFISPSTPAQYAAMAAFHPDTTPSWKNAAGVARKRRIFWSRTESGLSAPVVPEGAFYVYADCRFWTRTVTHWPRASCNNVMSQ